MKEQEVKDLIGEDNWEEFCEWMRGQTVGLNKDGSTDYYECDVKAFKRKLDTNIDRQQNPLTWD